MRSASARCSWACESRRSNADGALHSGHAAHSCPHARSQALHNHAVRFAEGGSSSEFSYTLPITYSLSLLPDVVCDLIELVARICRKVYYAALYAVHDEAVATHHDFFHWINEVGIAHVMLFLCAGYIGIAFLSWIINRFTDGILPSSRKLNQETRRKAEEYKAHKRRN